jgi:hypothetical protein
MEAVVEYLNVTIYMMGERKPDDSQSIVLDFISGLVNKKMCNTHRATLDITREWLQSYLFLRY